MRWGGDRAAVPDGRGNRAASIGPAPDCGGHRLAVSDGAPWRDLPERFGKWSPVYKNFGRWAKEGVWAKVLEQVQSQAHASGELDWVSSIDSTIVRVHQHGATLPRRRKGLVELQEVRDGAA
jgi:transposase